MSRVRARSIPDNETSRNELFWNNILRFYCYIFSKIGKLKCFCNKTKFFKLKKFQSRQFVDYMWSTHPNQPSSYMYMYLHWLTFRAGLLCCPERLYRPFPGHFPLDMPPWIFRQTFLQGQFPPDIPLSLIPCSAWISLHYIGYLN